MLAYPVMRVGQLDLSCNTLGAAGAMTLAPTLATGALTNINLSHNTLGNEGVGAICEAIQSSKETKLVTLNLGKNNIDPAGAQLVARLFHKIDSLAAVDLSFNNVGDGERDFVNAHEVQAPPLIEGKNVIYQGREMIISYASRDAHASMGKDGYVKMRPATRDLSGVTAIADASRELTKIS